MAHPTMALSWQLMPASMNPTLSSPHYSPILTSTPPPARRTSTWQTASTPCRTTTPCTPSVTDPGENFPTPSPSSLEAGALHYPSPPPSLLRIRRIPLNLTTTNRNLLYNRSPPQRASLGAATLRVLHPQRPVHHLIRPLRIPQMTMDRPSRYE